MTRTTKQLNVEIDIDLANNLRDRCKKSGRTQREVLELLIEVWLTTNEGRGARHLDGTECPLSFFLTELSAQVRSMMNNTPPPPPPPVVDAPK